MPKANQDKMMESAKQLCTKRKRISQKILHPTEIIKGSLVRMARTCGKPKCRCQKGHKHISLYLSQSIKGKTRMTYIPRDMESCVKEAVRRYQEIKTKLTQISEINIQLLIQRALNGKKK